MVSVFSRVGEGCGRLRYRGRRHDAVHLDERCRLVDSAAQRDFARRRAEAPGARPTTKPAIGHRGEPSVVAACRTGGLGRNPWVAPDQVSPYTRSSSTERTILDLHHDQRRISQ
jgi:hypothetical protein